MKTVWDKIVSDCIWALRNQPEITREQIAEILERYLQEKKQEEKQNVVDTGT